MPFQPQYSSAHLLQMYEFAMDGVQQHLVKKSQMARLTYTSELIPERSPDGQMYVLRFLSLIASHS